MTQIAPPTNRERQVLDLLVAMHGEYGLDAHFTRAAIEHLLDSPAAGSLAGLALNAYITQRTQNNELVYAVTEQGFALYAGLDLP